MFGSVKRMLGITNYLRVDDNVLWLVTSCLFPLSTLHFHIWHLDDIVTIMIFEISPTHLPVLLLQLGSGRKSGTGEPLSPPLSTTIVHRVVYIALHHHHHLHGALYSVAPPPFHCTSPPPPCIVQCIVQCTTTTIAVHNITPSLPPSCSPPCIMQCTLHCASTTTLQCTLHTAPCTTISCILLYWTALHCTMQ